MSDALLALPPSAKIVYVLINFHRRMSLDVTIDVQDVTSSTPDVLIASEMKIKIYSRLFIFVSPQASHGFAW